MGDVIPSKGNPEPKVVVSWRQTNGQPSSAWRKLVHKLLRGRGKNLPLGDNCNGPKGDQG